jgi:hypothetical protein
VYQLNGGEISFRLREPSGVFISELSAIFMALVLVRDHHPAEFIILSDSITEDLNGVVVGYADCYSKGPGFEFGVSHGPFQKV